MAYTTIDDPSAYFHTQLYTGTGSTNAITNDANAGNFSPDWLWIKNRSSSGGTGPHIVFDTTRGNTKDFHVNNTEAEHTNSHVLLSFDTDGFSVGTSGAVNNNTDNFVAWQWKANGGTTSSNTDGSITSTVQANTTAGFSIVTWTGTGASATVGHGLSSAPQLIIVKNRTDGATDWRIGNTVVSGKTMSDDNGYYLEFDTGAIANPGSATIWGSPATAPTSSVFSVGSNNSNNGSSDNMLAYCFHSVQGYSKIGSYTGNGNDNGAFVYTGFAPAWVLLKNTTDTGDDWHLFDTTRDPINRASQRLKPNASDAEASDGALDFLSNGFKLRNTSNARNGSGDTIIYMAFAEHPFVSSEGVPTTAR